MKPHTYNFNLKPIAGEVLAIYGVCMVQLHAAHWLLPQKLSLEATMLALLS